MRQLILFHSSIDLFNWFECSCRWLSAFFDVFSFDVVAVFAQKIQTFIIDERPFLAGLSMYEVMLLTEVTWKNAHFILGVCSCDSKINTGS